MDSIDILKQMQDNAGKQWLRLANYMTSHNLSENGDMPHSKLYSELINLGASIVSDKNTNNISIEHIEDQILLYTFRVNDLVGINTLDEFTAQKKVKEKARHILLKNIKKAVPELEALLKEINGMWVFEDSIYRLYHYSFKVYNVQEYTLKIVNTLKELLPEMPLNSFFQEIIQNGTGKEFRQEVNSYWLKETVPLTTAFFHAKYMLEMVVKYGLELDVLPSPLPSGWASVLCLYNLR